MAGICDQSSLETELAKHRETLREIKALKKKYLKDKKELQQLLLSYKQSEIRTEQTLNAQKEKYDKQRRERKAITKNLKQIKYEKKNHGMYWILNTSENVRY